MDNDIKEKENLEQSSEQTAQETIESDELYIAAKEALEENIVLKEAKEKLEEENAKLKEELESQNAKVNDLELKIGVMQESINEITTKYVESNAKTLSILKLMLDKITLEEFDDSLNKLSSKSIEYLNDAIDEHFDELKKKVTIANTNKVENPANIITQQNESAKIFNNRWEFEEFLSKELKKLF